ncbi:MAG: nucleoside-diphosphate kinase [Bryobacterales bacterium]
MAIQRTLTIIKPDSTSAGHIGEIIADIEKAGFRILGMRMVQLSLAQAQAFYAVHRERPFYKDLVKFMTEGPVVPMALEREDAVASLRKLMGETDSKKAAKDTIRGKFGTDIERNAIHGSDAPETAANEIAFFFSQSELG